MILTFKDPSIAAEKRRDRILALAEWHTFFCVRPRKIAPNTYAFMHFVQRRIHPGRIHDTLNRGRPFHQWWEYRTHKQALVEAAHGRRDPEQMGPEGAGGYTALELQKARPEGEHYT